MPPREQVVGEVVGRARRWRPGRGASSARRRARRARCTCRSGGSRRARRAGRRRRAPASATRRGVVAGAADQRDLTPARASQAATFAPDPPGRSVIRAGVSLPRRERRVVERHDVDHQVAEDDDARHSAPRSPRPARRCAAPAGRSRAGSRPPCASGSARAGTGSRRGPRRPRRPPRRGPRADAVVQLGVDLLVERVGDHDRAGRAELRALAQHRRRLGGESTRHGTGSPESVR